MHVFTEAKKLAFEDIGKACCLVECLPTLLSLLMNGKAESRSKLFYDLDQINPKLKILSDNYEIIKNEFIKNKNKLTWTNWNSNNEYTSITDNPYNGWKVAALSCQYNYSMLKKPSEYSKIFNTNIHFDHDNELMYTDNAFILPNVC